MRGATAHISSIEDLKTWFSAQKRPEWSLMSGFQDAVAQKNLIYRSADDSLDMENSWLLLEQMITINTTPGARFTIFVPNNDHGNRGHLVRLQTGEAPHPYAPAYGAGMAGIGQALSKTEINEIVEEKRKLWELERKVEDLETRPSLGGIGDVLKEKLLESDFTPVIAGIMEMLTAAVKNFTSKSAPLAVSVQGVPEDATGDQSAGAGYHYEAEKIIPCLDRIRPHFADDESFYLFMEKISRKFEESPAMYKQLIG